VTWRGDEGNIITRRKNVYLPGHTHKEYVIIVVVIIVIIIVNGVLLSLGQSYNNGGC